MKIHFDRKTIGYLFLVSILVIGNIFIVLKINKKNQTIATCAKNWQKCTEKNEYLINYFIEREKKCIESENFHISELIELKGLDDNVYPLSEKLNKSPILVFRFTGSQCQTCINTEIERMTEFLRDLSPEKVVILVSDKNLQDLSYLKKVKKINFEIYLVKKEEIIIPLEQYNIPYSFILTPDGFINSVFIPELNEKKFSEQYYTLIKSILL